MTAPDRRKGWRPQPRPEWVRRINEEGSYQDLRGIIPLDENSLIATAKANTGFDDFGADDWHEPFQVLVKSLDQEANLNFMGRFLARADLLMYLEGRLGIEHTYRQHPEIADQPIVAPLLIMGQGRCGTTWMHNLLANDPTNRTPMTWEVLLPYPPPEKATFKTDPRIAVGVNRMGLWNRVTPEIESMHDFAGDIPTENIHVQCLSFQSPIWFNMMGRITSYNLFMHQRGLAQAFAYEKRVLKYLQWKNPGQRWLQKCPVYVDMMLDALKEFPDARFIWMHRDPIKSLSSAVAVAGTLYWGRADLAFTDNSPGSAMGDLEVFTSAEFTAQSMNRAIGWLEEGKVPKSQFASVYYHELLADPLGTVRKLYDQFGISVPDSSWSAMNQYLVDNARDRQKKKPYVYDLGSPEQIARERTFYQRYQTYFNVPNEA